jgi:hypothetical protein
LSIKFSTLTSCLQVFSPKAALAIFTDSGATLSTAGLDTTMVKTKAKRPLGPTMAAMCEVYPALCAPSKPVWKLSWRLPPEVFEPHIVQPFREICKRQGVATKFCMKNLVEIP